MTKTEADAEYKRNTNPWAVIQEQAREIARLTAEIERLKDAGAKSEAESARR